MKPFTILLSLLTTTQTPSLTSATFTIAAADSATQQIGASGSSCVSLNLYKIAYHSIPGHGLCMTQASPPPNQEWNSEVTHTSPVYGIIDVMVADDTDPVVIIDTITNAKLDDEREVYWVDGFHSFEGVDLRQYGCVDVQGRAAGYTGTSLHDYYDMIWPNNDSVQEDKQGSFGDMVYSAQGNIVSKTTVTTIANAFLEDEACDLVERLYHSLAAMFESDELIGDIRCFDTNSAPGSSIFIHADNDDGSEVIHIQNEDPNPEANPWKEFKAEYEQWRSENPCPTVVDEEAHAAVSL